MNRRGFLAGLLGTAVSAPVLVKEAPKVFSFSTKYVEFDHTADAFRYSQINALLDERIREAERVMLVNWEKNLFSTGDLFGLNTHYREEYANPCLQWLNSEEESLEDDLLPMPEHPDFSE